MKQNNKPFDPLNENFQDGKSFARSPELDHAAGDYEPLESSLHPSTDPELVSSTTDENEITNLTKENRIQFPTATHEQFEHDEQVEIEAVHRENEISDLRANREALDPDRN
jgi:hypothetical protein